MLELYSRPRDWAAGTLIAEPSLRPLCFQVYVNPFFSFCNVLLEVHLLLKIIFFSFAIFLFCANSLIPMVFFQNNFFQWSCFNVLYLIQCKCYVNKVLKKMRTRKMCLLCADVTLFISLLPAPLFADLRTVLVLCSSSFFLIMTSGDHSCGWFVFLHPVNISHSVHSAHGEQSGLFLGCSYENLAYSLYLNLHIILLSRNGIL